MRKPFVTRLRPPDAPTPADLHRLRRARRDARAAVADAEAHFEAARLAAFRRELTSTVRCASPFLLSLLAEEGLALDDVVARIVPAPGWPRRPRLSRSVSRRSVDLHAVRHALTAVAIGLPYKEAEMLHEHGFPLRNGGWARVRVVAHTLEVKVKTGPAVFETLFGELRITVQGALPLALAAGAIGRPLDDMLMHPATSGRDWLVSRVDVFGSVTTVVAAIGSIPVLLRRFDEVSSPASLVHGP